MVLNTTRGPQEVPRGEARHINTTAILEPPLMAYEGEEPEIASVVSAAGWCAVIGDEAVPLPLWVLLDDGSVYGVAVGADGLLDALDNVENNPNFVRYSRGANINDKE